MNNTDNINTSQKKKVPYIVLSFICTAMLIYLSAFSIVPITSFIGLVLFCVFSCLYSVLLSCANKISVLIPPIVSVIVLMLLSGFDFGIVTILAYSNLLFALLTATMLSLCQIKNATKSVTFGAISVTISAYICALLIMLVYFVYGKADLNTIYEAIDEGAEFIASLYKETLVTVTQELPEGSFDASDIRNMAKSMELSLKMSIPSTIATFAMGISALCVTLYRPIAAFAGNKDECTENRLWFFNLSRTSAVFFELVFLAYIIITLFGNNLTLLSAFMNLISVLTVPFSYVGLRYVYLFVCAKTSKKLSGIIVLVLAFIVMSLLLGAGSFFTLSALMGASSIINKRYIIRKR